MAKEKNFNPVQAQHKADKAKAIKKGKSEVQARRNEKLARRNPDGIQTQIDGLKAIAEGGGKLTRHEEQLLEGLEKELRAVKRAREALGDNAPPLRGSRPSGGPGGGNRSFDRQSGVLGKRRRFGDDELTSEEDVPDDVKSIPMPRDTPPPVPKEYLDRWYAKRRANREAEMRAKGEGETSTDAGDRRHAGSTGTREPKEPVVPKTVYEAMPVVRDLQKEAVKAFVPTTVRLKMERGKGKGGLLEPEEADRLEKEGYMKPARAEANDADRHEADHSRAVTMEDVDDEEG